MLSSAEAPMLRRIPSSLDPNVVAAINGRLRDVEREQNAVIAIAIESGSRAWGFPSPDSDYDCRFIYVRHEEEYLSPWLRRDVIETPLDAVFDVNGWDLGKTLKLLLKGNAVAIEWLMSPIVYRADALLREELLQFADEFVERDRIINHYRRLGDRQRRTYFADGKEVALKKLFYALRPAAALRWLRRHPEARIVPMEFQTLMTQCDPPPDVAGLAAELIAAKAEMREMGMGPLPPIIERFVAEEFAAAAAATPDSPPPPSPGARDTAERLFRRTVRRLAPGVPTCSA
jgi:predicted nucleotidyltransferase